MSECIVISCANCGAFHVVFNGPPPRRACIDCGGWMHDAASLAQACEAFDRIKRAAQTK
jgi:hypothetical protein